MHQSWYLVLQNYIELEFICLNCHFLLCFEHCLLSFESFLILLMLNIGYLQVGW